MRVIRAENLSGHRHEFVLVGMNPTNTRPMFNYPNLKRTSREVRYVTILKSKLTYL